MTSAFDPLQFGPHLDVAWRSCAGANAFPGLENQDNFLLIDQAGRAVFLREQQEQRELVDNWKPGHARIAVLDGMGGHGHGRAAAQAVVDALLEMPACASIEELSLRLDALHDGLQRHFAELLEGNLTRRPGTTLTLLELRPGLPALLYHVGDSRLYQNADGKLTALTLDHVPATWYAMTGSYDHDQWQDQVHGQYGTQICQAFILGNAFDRKFRLRDTLVPLSQGNLPPYLGHLVDRRAIALQDGASYLLATDGLWACDRPGAWVGSWPGRLTHCPSAHAMVDTLFDDLVNDPPPVVHVDNLTAIVIRVGPQAPASDGQPALRRVRAPEPCANA